MFQKIKKLRMLENKGIAHIRPCMAHIRLESCVTLYCNMKVIDNIIEVIDCISILEELSSFIYAISYRADRADRKALICEHTQSIDLSSPFIIMIYHRC